jgi:alkylation response protein AidB-like acyl-CoA dehydrogenase
MQLYASGFACVGLGTARAALDAFIALAKDKSQAWSSERLWDNHAMQNIIGYADAALKAAKSALLNVLDEQWEAVGRSGELTVDGRIAVRQAATFAIHMAHDVVHQVYHEAGRRRFSITNHSSAGCEISTVYRSNCRGAGPISRRSVCTLWAGSRTSAGSEFSLLSVGSGPDRTRLIGIISRGFNDLRKFRKNYRGWRNRVDTRGDDAYKAPPATNPRVWGGPGSPGVL